MIDAVIWLPALAVGVVVSVLYRGWRYGESFANDGAYAAARTASRDCSTAEAVEALGALDSPADAVRCQHCGARNETDFEFCERCTTRLPDRRGTRRGVARPGD